MIYDSAATAAATCWRLHLRFFTRGWGTIAEVQLCWFLEVYWNDNDFFVYFNSLKVHTGKLVSNSRTFQGLLKDFPTVFKD